MAWAWAFCFSHTSVRIFPGGRVRRWMCEELSVIMDVYSAEGKVTLVYQTKFRRREPGWREPFSPGMMYLGR